METVKISDFLYQGESIFGVSNSFYLSLYNFFKTHSASADYSLEGAAPFTEAEILSLSAHHVFTQNHAATLEREIYHKQFIILEEAQVRDKDALGRIMNNVISNARTPGLVFIEKDYNKVSLQEFTEDINCVKASLIGCAIINERVTNEKSLLTNEDVLRSLKEAVDYHTGNHYTLVDITEEFVPFASIISVNDYCKYIGALAEKVCSQYQGKTDVILYAEGLTYDVEKIYCVLAAYCLVQYSIKFYITSGSQLLFNYYVGMVRNKSSMFLNDWLCNLANFPAFSVSCNQNQCYLWVTDFYAMLESSTVRDYEISLTLYKAKVNIHDWSLLEDFKKEPINIPLRMLNIRRFRDYNDLDDSDTSVAIAAYKKMNKLFKAATCSLRDCSVLESTETLTLEDMLLFEQGSELFVAYVSKVNGAIPFFVYPLTKRDKPFRAELPINKLESLQDPRVYFDSEKYIEKILAANHNYQNNYWVNDRNTIRGLLLQGFAGNRENFDVNCGFSFNEVGVWSHATLASRTTYKSAFQKLFSSKAVDKWESIYGKQHPMISNRYFIASDDWRY